MLTCKLHAMPLGAPLSVPSKEKQDSPLTTSFTLGTMKKEHGSIDKNLFYISQVCKGNANVTKTVKLHATWEYKE